MKLKVYVVDLELPRWARRLVSGGLAAGAMAAVTLGGVAYAAIKYTYKSSDTLSSADMTDTLGDLNTRLKTVEQGRLVGTVNGKAYSVGATEFKVVTSKGGPLNNGTYNGKQVGGYPNAKSICETAVGSMTAHMCSSEELVRSVAGGLTPPQAWYSTGVYATDGAGPFYPAWDCAGWTSSSTMMDGPLWGTPAQPSTNSCDQINPVLCCD